MFAGILLNASHVMALSPPIMAEIYTLLSLICCDELKVLFVIEHHLWI